MMKLLSIMRSFFSLLLALLLTVSCSPLSKKAMNRLIVDEERGLQNHMGLQVYDPAKNKVVYSYQDDRYFTPASNTKVLTFYTALTILSDSIPSIKYSVRNDSLIVIGMGDPCFLNPECYNNFRIYDFLRNAPGSLYFSFANFQMEHFGNGWAWDDYSEYYSTERTSFSIFGNSFSFYPLPDKMLVTPTYFQKFLRVGTVKSKPELTREWSSNYFTYHPGANKKFRPFIVPFHSDLKTFCELLSDTLHRKVGMTNAFQKSGTILFSMPVDSVYRVMMQESDNHLAEQLLIICSGVLSDTLNSEIAIRFMQQNHFKNYVDKPVWFDGSGLSRYNLVTPRFMVQLWNNIYNKVPQERLFSLLATGGFPGTLQNWFKADKPYVFGKTGTLSNNHSLSGYLVTRSGKLLIFAFMNANYVRPVRDVRNNMQRILNLYYENY
jgi:serine-type D-Ala-D-Ala carboxypeptidase/endopeptidase (penicillin-binding protein 4)